MNESKERQQDAFLLSVPQADQLFVNQTLSSQIPKPHKVFGAGLSTTVFTYRKIRGLHHFDTNITFRFHAVAGSAAPSGAGEKRHQVIF